MKQSQLLQIFENEDQSWRIFLDMDGCLTDFVGQFQKYANTDLTPQEYEDKHGKSAFWDISHNIEEFWTTMPWMPDGKELFESIKHLNPTILSAPSKDPKSTSGKVKWLKDNLSLPNYNLQTKAKHGWDGSSKIILNADKFRYCSGPRDVLIDDTEKKINPWIAKGGVGILHTNTKNTLNKLRELKIL